MDIFILYPVSPLSPSLWEMARYRLKYCLKGPLNPKQPTNQPRSSGLAKTILQGTVKGKRKRGRQKKGWEDNIKEWTGMDFTSSIRQLKTGQDEVPRQASKVMG